MQFGYAPIVLELTFDVVQDIAFDHIFGITRVIGSFIIEHHRTGSVTNIDLPVVFLGDGNRIEVDILEVTALNRLSDSELFGDSEMNKHLCGSIFIRHKQRIDVLTRSGDVVRDGEVFSVTVDGVRAQGESRTEFEGSRHVFGEFISLDLDGLGAVEFGFGAHNGCAEVRKRHDDKRLGQVFGFFLTVDIDGCHLHLLVSAEEVKGRIVLDILAEGIAETHDRCFAGSSYLYIPIAVIAVGIRVIGFVPNTKGVLGLTTGRHDIRLSKRVDDGEAGFLAFLGSSGTKHVTDVVDTIDIFAIVAVFGVYGVDVVLAYRFVEVPEHFVRLAV